MPDDNPTSEEPAAPAEPAPTTEPDPQPAWPDVSKPETRGGNRDDYRFKTRG